MSDAERIVDEKTRSDSEVVFERSLRPTTFDEVIGREQEKKSLKIMMEAAKIRKEPLDHILFHGPPGLGKTTLSSVLSNEMRVPMHITSGSAIDKAGDLAAILTSLELHSILFIDEIHRMKRTIEEILYPAMEDSALDIVIGKGPNARTLRIDLEPFTIVGATTKLSMISAPLRDRFGMSFRLDFYTDDELQEMVFQKAKMLRIGIDQDAAMEVAKRSRMTARIAVRLLKRVRDVTIVEKKDRISIDLVNKTLNMLGVDVNGLDDVDRAIMGVLINNFSNKPVGLSTLAASLSEESETIETVYEPFLLKKGFLQRTARGRLVTSKGIQEYGELLSE